jgi:hypothetical protein
MSGKDIVLLVLATAAIFTFIGVVSYIFDLSLVQFGWLDATLCAAIVLVVIWWWLGR